MNGMSVRSKYDRLYLWCPICCAGIRTWAPGAPVELAAITTAEEEHGAIHVPPIDYQALHDGFYENGLG